MGMGETQNAKGEGPRLVPVTGNKASEAASVARLVTVGVGGGGVNAVNHMIQSAVRGVEFVAMNTDAQALDLSRAPRKLRLGESLTRGLGAGGNPEIGRKAAEESYQAIRDTLAGADLVFVTAGMGGGTGTGASPLVAQAAREQGALAVAVVTTPFAFERKRKLVAQEGVAMLRDVVDALIVVPNERLTQLASRDVSAFEAYRMADDVLRQGIQGISDLITIPGLINLDFADIRAVMADAGTALMGVGQASGDNRAEVAAKGAITNSLLDVDVSGARGIVFNISASDDLTLSEVDRIAEIITQAAQADATVTFGTVYDPNLSGTVKVTVVATGFEPRVRHAARPRPAGAAGSPPPTPISARGEGNSAGGMSAQPQGGILVQRPIILRHDETAAPEPAQHPAAAVNGSTNGHYDGFHVAPAERAERGDAPSVDRNATRPARRDERAALIEASDGYEDERNDRFDSRGMAAEPRRTDERAPVQRAGARRLDGVESRVRATYAPRQGAAPGQFDDEYLANDEPEYDEHPARWGLSRIFARH